jgi:hypothetical protein
LLVDDLPDNFVGRHREEPCVFVKPTGSRSFLRALVWFWRFAAGRKLIWSFELFLWQNFGGEGCARDYIDVWKEEILEAEG